MGEKNIKVRYLTKSDVPHLLEIDKIVWNDDNSPMLFKWESLEEYEKNISSDKYSAYLVAEKDGQVCGFVNSRSSKLKSNQHVMEIAIAVHPQFQKLGIGRKLLDAVFEWGKKNGKKKISLRVMSSNSSALQFYKACGFMEQGRFIDEFYINKRYVDDVFMYKLILS